MIIYIHGYGSSAATSNTCDSLKTWFQDEVICFDYDYMDPIKAAAQLDEQILDVGVENIDLVVGSSLGGFWARHLANQYKLPLMMINPSLDPARNLKKYGTYSTEHLIAFNDFYVSTDDPSIPITVVLGMSDTVIDPYFTYDKYKERARIHQIAGEGHQIKTKTLKDFVSNAANSIALA